jgi:hypothetical protein
LGVLGAVDVVGNKRAFRDDRGSPIGLERTEEAAAVALVANAGTQGFDEEKKSVGITVDTNLANAEDMATGFALFPKAIAGAREEMDLAGKLSLFESLRVEIAEHENVAALVVLNNPGDKSARFFKCQMHDGLPKNEKPAGRFAPAGRVELVLQ